MNINTNDFDIRKEQDKFFIVRTTDGWESIFNYSSEEEAVSELMMGTASFFDPATGIEEVGPYDFEIP